MPALRLYYKPLNNSHPELFYIICYRLNKNIEGINLLNKINAQDDLNSFFYWQRNGGIYFKKEFFPTGERALENLSADSITKMLEQVLISLDSKKSSKIDKGSIKRAVKS